MSGEGECLEGLIILGIIAAIIYAIYWVILTYPLQSLTAITIIVLIIFLIFLPNFREISSELSSGKRKVTNRFTIACSLLGGCIGSLLGFFLFLISPNYVLYNVNVRFIFLFINLIIFFGIYVYLYYLVILLTEIGIGTPKWNEYLPWLFYNGLLGTGFGLIFGLVFNLETMWIYVCVIIFIIFSLIPIANMGVIGIMSCVLGYQIINITTAYPYEYIFNGQHYFYMDYIHTPLFIIPIFFIIGYKNFKNLAKYFLEKKELESEIQNYKTKIEKWQKEGYELSEIDNLLN